jgi:hypothetical protein
MGLFLRKSYFHSKQVFLRFDMADEGQKTETCSTGN